MRKGITQIYILLLSTLLLFLSSHELNKNSVNRSEEFNFKVESLDGMIRVSWHRVPKLNGLVNISVYNDEGMAECINMPVILGKYDFKDGKHGFLYHIEIDCVEVENSDAEQHKLEVDRLFINYSKLPQIKTLSISTADNQDPIYEEADRPESRAVGSTITNNDYKSCIISELRDHDFVKIASGLIRVRGNTSAFEEKKPYRIKLDNPQDLIENNISYADEDWLLLNGSTLNAYIGNYISLECGSEWQPRIIPINLIVNNDWKGCYYLTENIKKGKNRLNICNDGFIVENDAYWWNSNNVFFKTNKQESRGCIFFTIKYPKVTSIDSNTDYIRSTIQRWEDAIWDMDEKYSNYIDIQSFSSYILARDLLGCTDLYGSNMFYYKYDSTDSSKIKAGPVWDFDSDYSCKIDNWSSYHYYLIILGFVNSIKKTFMILQMIFC